MNEQEKEEAKAKKFHKRLERISRRRFMKLATIGGAAGVGILVSGRSAAVPPTLLERCTNSKLLCGEETVASFFLDPFNAVLNRTIAKVSPDLRQKVQAVIDGLGRDPKRDRTIRSLIDLFHDDPLTDYPNTRGALGLAEPDFVIPCLGLVGKERAAAYEFLTRPTTDADPVSFMRAFGHYRLVKDDYPYGLMRTPLQNFNPWEQKLLREALGLGILRPSPRNRVVMTIAATQQCAVFKNGGWTCVDSTDPQDKCSIENGQPTAATDLCP